MVICLYEHVLLQRYRTLFRHDQRGFATNRFDPFGKILDIGNRRGKTYDVHVFRQVDNDFFPDRPSETVSKIVHFVKDHITKRFKRHGMLIQHIAQHFRGHDHNIRLRVDGRVSGQQSDLIRSILVDQIMVFLVAQRFDRRGIKGFDIPCLRQIDGEIGCDSLACSRRSCHEHIIASLQRIVGLHLEFVKLEWHGSCEFGRNRALLGLRLFECGIPLRGRHLHGLIDFRRVNTVITATMMGHDSLIWLGQSLQ